MKSSSHPPEKANDNDPDDGNRVSFVRTVAVRVDPAKSATPFWTQQILEFEALEVQPHSVIHGSSCGSYLEPCGREEAEVWTVNGRYRRRSVEPPGPEDEEVWTMNERYRWRSVEPCEDFATEAEALAFRDRLIAAYPHLAEQVG